jgi:hypothetical protein
MACSHTPLAELLRPVPTSAVFRESGFNVWCGSPIRDVDGTYHLFYSRWPARLGHLAWVSHSEVARAVSASPLGPYRFAEVVLPPRDPALWDGRCTHNPTVQRFDGRYYLYYMGNTGDGRVGGGLNWDHRNRQRVGVAVADRITGPWRRSDTPLLQPTPGFFDALCLNNPSVMRHADGRTLMIYKAVGDRGTMPFGGPVVHVAAVADDPAGPFTKLPGAVFTVEGEHFAAEDPYVWREGSSYRAIVKDNHGVFTGEPSSLAEFESADGVNWTLSDPPLVCTREVRWADGRTTMLTKLERPQLLFDEAGVPIALFCAASDRDDVSDSFNVHIPLAGAR